MARSDDASITRITTGQLSWSAGVDSSKLTAIATEANPTGLKANQLAWLINGTVRGGGISPRSGWKYIGTMPVTAQFQEASFYKPDGGFPYLMAAIGGRMFRVQVDTGFAVDDVTIPGNPNPANLPKNWMQQGEQFLVTQDGQSLPLIWDGDVLRRSDGPRTVLGVITANTGKPIQYTFLDFALNAPGFTGYVNQIVIIGTAQYLQVEPDNFATLDNVDDPRQGALLTAGSELLDGTGAIVATTLVPFSIPAIGGSNTPSFIVTDYAGPLPLAVTIDGHSWQISAQGHVAPAPNHVFLVNFTDPTPGVIPGGSPIYSVPEIPTAECMDYYMGRLWYGQGRQFAAGDIVLGPSGTPQYSYRDAILKQTENTYLVGGGAFVTPTNDGELRAFNHTANQDSSLGEGTLYGFTPQAIYAVHVTPDRASWATQQTPLITTSQRGQGDLGDRCVTPVNSDLFYRSSDGIRSLLVALRYQDQWANTPISSEVSRALNLDDRALLSFASGIEFDNRLYMTCQPFQTDIGVAFRGIVSLDFNLISGIGEKLPPAWEGMLEGLDVLKILEANFGGLQRAFAFVLGRESQQIELWELTLGDRFDNNQHGEARITWASETPSFAWDTPFKLKKLETAELQIDRLFGTVDFAVWYRPGQSSCWYWWCSFRECAPRSSCEDIPPTGDCLYPQQPYPEQYRSTIMFPTPQMACNSTNGRLSHIDYAFQVRIVVTGFCRIRGLYVHANPVVRASYDGLRCP